MNEKEGQALPEAQPIEAWITKLLEEADRANDALLGVHLSMALTDVQSSENYFRSPSTLTFMRQRGDHQQVIPLSGSVR